MTADNVSIRTGTSELVDQAEISRRLGVSPEWVRRLYNEGELPLEMGTLGPRKVWRWAPVRDWAYRSGRLPVRPRAGTWYATTIKGRRRRRAWCDGCTDTVELIDEAKGVWRHVNEGGFNCRCPGAAES